MPDRLAGTQALNPCQEAFNLHVWRHVDIFIDEKHHEGFIYIWVKVFFDPQIPSIGIVEHFYIPKFIHFNPFTVVSSNLWRSNSK